MYLFIWPLICILYPSFCNLVNVFSWVLWGAPLMVHQGKNLPAMRETQETQVGSLTREGPLEEEMAIHSSILAWNIPWTEEPLGLKSMRLQRVGHGWAMKHTGVLWAIPANNQIQEGGGNRNFQFVVKLEAVGNLGTNHLQLASEMGGSFPGLRILLGGSDAISR